MNAVTTRAYVRAYTAAFVSDKMRNLLKILILYHGLVDSLKAASSVIKSRMACHVSPAERTGIEAISRRTFMPPPPAPACSRPRA